MQRIFCTTDTHGCNKQLNTALRDASFDFDSDKLIHLGDITDRGPDSFGVVETLLKVKNLIAIRGNHDAAVLEFINTGYHSFGWMHGAYKTVMSYINAQDITYDEVSFAQKLSGISTNFAPKHMPESHRNFFKNQVRCYVDEQNRLFIHAGYDPMEPLEHQTDSTLYWDRDLVQGLAYTYEMGGSIDRYPDVNDFKRVFVGHTPTIVFKRHHDKLSPLWLPGGAPFNDAMYMGQLVNLDTGICFGNKLTLIDITDDDDHIIYTAT